MRNSTILISLLISLSACNQATEQKEQESTVQSQAVTQPNNSAEKTNEEERLPQLFIDVAKNLDITPQEFAQAMEKAGGYEAGMAGVAKELGIPIADLQAALPKRPPRKITFEPAAGVEVQKSTELETDVKASE